MSRSVIPGLTILEADGDVLATEFGDEIVMLNLRDGVYYGLDDVGARVWQLLRTPISLNQIRDTLVAEYDVDPARCERDIRSLILELTDRGLVNFSERR